jgi:hypothetical protein
MAAHHYEDALQCSIPVFDGIFEEPTNSNVKTLLFQQAMFHGLAKLRMHTDSSTNLLWNSTIRLCTLLRYFRDVVCPRFQTVETPAEAERRKRQAVARIASSGNSLAAANPDGRRERKFNLTTYKFHVIADYARLVETGVTLDSVSTNYVSLRLFPFPGQIVHR